MKSSKCTHCWWQGKFQKIDGFKKSTFLRKKPTTNPKLITEPPYKNPSQSFPCWRFQVLLTLFSEFFASFPRGTCLLSVSHQIFSLRWSLPPALGCTLKQPDSEEWKYVLVWSIEKKTMTIYGTITLYGALFQETLIIVTTPVMPPSLDYNSDADVTCIRF